MRRAFIVLLALLWAIAGQPVSASAGDWTLYKINGRDHVTLDNVADFYGLSGLQRVNKDFSMRLGARSLRGTVDSVEFYINNLKFNLSYPIVEYEGHLCISRMDLTKLIEPVLRPGKIKDAEKVNTVILDPGHGGHDSGAYSPYGYEKQYTLDVANRARMLLMQAGYQVELTRTTDTFVSLNDRTRFANRFPNALFVSIHFNSGGAGTGLETYTLAPRGVPSMAADGPRISDLDPCPGHVNDPQNMALATAMHASMVVRSRMYDRGIKRARFVVIRDITIPGVLVEGGFLSNEYDAKLVATPEYRQGMALSILQAVNNYRRAVGPHTPSVTSDSRANTQTEFARESAGGTPAPAPAN